MSGHTPGPWTLETVPTQVGSCHKIGPFPGTRARAVGYACVYADGEHWPDRLTEPGKELLANARLIAAAPDLLAFAKTFLARIEDDGEPTAGTRWHAEYVTAKALIARVQGGAA